MRFLDLELPSLFAVEHDAQGNWSGFHTRDGYGREEDGAYVCTNTGGSASYLRATERRGMRFTHVDQGGDGNPFDYRLRIVLPGDFPLEASHELLAERNLHDEGLVGELASFELAVKRSRTPASAAADCFPHERGIYAIFASRTGAEELFKPARAPHRELITTPQIRADDPIYIGRAERSLRSHDRAMHFTSGETSASTLRRSVAALLGPGAGWTFQSRRPAAPGTPSKRNDITHYRLDEHGEEALTAWMMRSLQVGWIVPPSETELGVLEKKAIDYYQPPLNLTLSKHLFATATREARAAVVRGLEAAGPR